MEPRKPRGDHQCDLFRAELAAWREQPFVGTAFLVALADDAWPPRVRPVIEQRPDLILDDRALLLDHEDLLQPQRERVQTLRLERPRETDLVDADADACGFPLVDAEMLERLPHVEIRFSGGDNAEPRLRTVVRDVVDPVRPRVGEHGGQPLLVNAPFHRQRLVRQAQSQPARRQHEVLGQADADARGIDADRRRALDRVVERLEGEPRARVARHREAVHTEVQVFLHAGGHQDRDHRRHQHGLALRRHGGGLRDMVVAAHQQHSAMLRRARRVAVQQRVAGAREARPLAVPHAEYALIARMRVERHLLRAPDAHHRELFVLARLEMDVMPLQQVVRLPQRLVHVVERRALETGDEARGVEPGSSVAHALHDQQPGERLDAVQVNTAAFERVFVVELDIGKLHGASPTDLLQQITTKRRLQLRRRPRGGGDPVAFGRKTLGSRLRGNDEREIVTIWAFGTKPLSRD